MHRVNRQSHIAVTNPGYGEFTPQVAAGFAGERSVIP